MHQNVSASSKTNWQHWVSILRTTTYFISQVRTIKLYTDHVIRSKENPTAVRKEQEKLKALLNEQFERGEEPNHKSRCD